MATKAIKKHKEQTPLKHVQVREALMHEINNRHWKEGDRLPSEADMVARFNVSRITVVRVLRDLMQEGYIERRRGAGTFLSKKIKNASSASATLSSRSGIYSVIVDDVNWGFNHTILSAISNELKSQDAGTMYYAHGNDVAEQGNLILRVLHDRVAGVVLMPVGDTVTPAYHVEVLQSSGIPVVLLFNCDTNLKAPRVLVPMQDIGYDVGKRLLSKGHRRIACIFASHSLTVADYVIGLRKAMEEDGGTLEDAAIHYGVARKTPVTEEHRHLLKKFLMGLFAGPADARPTAIFNPWDADAALIYILLERMGLRVPEDVSIVSLGLSRRTSSLHEFISAVAIDEEYIGRKVGRVLLEIHEGTRKLNDDEVIVTRWNFYEGHTVADISGRLA